MMTKEQYDECIKKARQIVDWRNEFQLVKSKFHNNWNAPSKGHPYSTYEEYKAVAGYAEDYHREERLMQQKLSDLSHSIYVARVEIDRVFDKGAVFLFEHNGKNYRLIYVVDARPMPDVQEIKDEI